MATYTKLDKQEIQSLADSYNLKVIDFSSIKGGNGNSSYVISTLESSYVLTVCDDKEVREVLNLGKLLVLLKDHQLSCNRIVLTTDHKFFTLLKKSENLKPVMLKEYINGEVQKKLNISQLIEVGRQLAKLNQVPPPVYLSNFHSYGKQVFENVIGSNIDIEYESWLAKELDYLDKKINKNLPKGLIHGDLFYDNILFNSNPNSLGAFKAVIDFEEACNYYLVFELGMCILGTCINNSNIDLVKARALLKGYQQIRELEKIEKINLQLFVRYAATATSYWRFKKYNILTPIKEKANDHWEMAKISNKVAKIVSSKFNDEIFGSNFTK